MLICCINILQTQFIYLSNYRGSTGNGVDKNPFPFPTLAIRAIFPDSAPAATIHKPNTNCCVLPFDKFT